MNASKMRSVESGRDESASKELVLENVISANERWKRQRARLHHDWLQNSYITFLKAQAECIDDPARCGERFDDILEQLLVWETKRVAFGKFIEKTVEALSPRQLLHVPPLDKMKNEDKEWLDPLVHALYLERTGIIEKVQSLNETLEEIDGLVETLAAGLRGEGPVEEGSGQRLLEKVLALSRQISSLPHDTQIV